MAISNINIVHTEPNDPLVRNLGKRVRLHRFADVVNAIASGGRLNSTVYRGTCAAYATWALSSASGDVTATINGVANTVTYATSDANTAGLMVVAINSATDDLVEYATEADNRSATLTFVSASEGATIKVCGYELRTMGDADANGGDGRFTVGGTDTQDAAACVVAINTFPGLNDLVFASNSSGVVTIRSRRASTATSTLGLRVTSGTGITASAAILAAGATVAISARHKGVSGNWITLSATGTGATASAARLAGGTVVVETY